MAPMELFQARESGIHRGNHLQMSVYLKTWACKSASSSLFHSCNADYLPCLWAQTAPDVCYQAFPGSEFCSLHIPTEQEMWLFFLCCTITAQVVHTNRNSCQEIIFVFLI